MISSAVRHSDDTESRKTVNGLLFLIMNIRNVRHFYIVETYGRVPKFTPVVVPVSHNEHLPAPRPTEKWIADGENLSDAECSYEIHHGLLTEM
jgi:hypothetical protein